MYKGSYLEYYVDSIRSFFQGLRFGRFPIWEHKGWQVIFYFGNPPGAMPGELMGWRTLLFGVLKVKQLPEDKNAEITSENIHGFLVQGQIWLPFDRFGKI